MTLINKIDHDQIELRFFKEKNEIGYAFIDINKEESFYYLDFVEIKEEYRGRGFFKELLSLLKEHILIYNKEIKFSSIILKPKAVSFMTNSTNLSDSALEKCYIKYLNAVEDKYRQSFYKVELN